jgi:hypothetical protein
MTDNNMPRGMLRGCQRRVDNLENHSLLCIVAMSITRAMKIFLGVSFLHATNTLRSVDWWQDSMIGIGDTMDLHIALETLPREFLFELTYPCKDTKLELAVAVINHFSLMPVGTFFWEPTSETEGEITLNWDVKYSYRVSSCQRLDEGSCHCKVVLECLKRD